MRISSEAGLEDYARYTITVIYTRFTERAWRGGRKAK
jgi:hypothetical protein